MKRENKVKGILQYINPTFDSFNAKGPKFSVDAFRWWDSLIFSSNEAAMRIYRIKVEEDLYKELIKRGLTKKQAVLLIKNNSLDSETKGLDKMYNEKARNKFIESLSYYQQIHLLMNYYVLVSDLNSEEAYKQALTTWDKETVSMALGWLVDMVNLKG